MDTDVLVVGAGPTGLMIACELALAGVRTRVLERRTERRRDSRALTLHPRSMELMDMRGLAPRFLALGRPVPGWHFAGLPTRLDFTALDTRHGYTLFLAQAHTEALLEQRAGELGVEISRGYETTDLRQDDDGVVLQAHGPAGAETLRARYAVGCDGARSTVRQAAGIAFPGTGETLTGVLGDFAAVGADPAALEAARAQGVLIAPLEHGLTRFVYIDPDRMRIPSKEPVTLEEFRTSLERICGSDCAVADPQWLSRFGNATRLADTYRSGRVLVAGDAAHIHFPAAGQGLNTGLQDAMNLGWKLAATAQGRAPVGLLDTYNTERRPAGRAVTENTEVQTLLAELTLLPQYQRPAAALRALLDQLLQLGEVNHLLAEQISALGTAYPPAEPSADPLIGRRMPDVGLTVADSEAERVHELLVRGRFLLLDLTGSIPRSPAPALGQNSHLTAHTVLRHDEHADLNGVTEILVRPDGHIAWATRTSDAHTLVSQRTTALATWTGATAEADV
ncbi:monooxygenase [Streptomyces sp. NBC_01142]|uniref:monooxygenase n=1 Tax=Streptomyces sp. NBC_01142 TaxID=2975865 RepID=UPI0022595796|nr:monooxygenase [Streptomyces sp. NBC_01142]MCX4821420.1 monooxygenase [Streptomyces sp. NBC_01142]